MYFTFNWQSIFINYLKKYFLNVQQTCVYLTFSLVISFTEGQSESFIFSAGFKNSTFFLLAIIWTASYVKTDTVSVNSYPNNQI